MDEAAPKNSEDPLPEFMVRAVLNYFAPATLLIDRQFTILCSRGNTADFLADEAGGRHPNLLALVREELGAGVRTVVAEALAGGSVASVHAEGEICRNQPPTLITAALAGTAADGTELVLVGFRPIAKSDAANRESSSAQEVEETPSGGRERPSAVWPVVHAGRRRADGGGDLPDRSELAILLLDPGLKIRSFTPAAGRLLDLLPEDAGRPVGDMRWLGDDPGLISAAELALKGRAAANAEVRIGSSSWYSRRVAPSQGSDRQVGGVVVSFVDISHHKERDRRQRFLLAELRHRVRNNLASVRSMAAETRRSTSNVDDFVEAFDGRLNALALAENLITRHNLETVDLHELIAEEFLSHGVPESKSLRLRGPAVTLRPQAAKSLAMALHELASNAVKHGALATGRGTVAISWEADQAGPAPHLTLEWLERGGKVDTTSTEFGFGLELVTQGLPYELGGASHVHFEEHGVQCRIVVPLSNEISAADLPESTGDTV